MGNKQSYGSWNMAGMRARNYASPKPRKFAAVGMTTVATLNSIGADMNDHLSTMCEDRTCRGCGCHLCSCLQRVRALQARAKPTGVSVRGYSLYTSSLVDPGQAFFNDTDRIAITDSATARHLIEELAAEEREQNLRSAEAEEAAVRQEHVKAHVRDYDKRAARADRAMLARGIDFSREHLAAKFPGSSYADALHYMRGCQSEFYMTDNEALNAAFEKGPLG